MRYLFRLILLLFMWPLLIIVMIVALTCYNLLMILWYFDFDHLYWEDNYWFPIASDRMEIKYKDENNPKSFYTVIYDEYYKTPKDLLLDIRTRVNRK